MEYISIKDLHLLELYLQLSNEDPDFIGYVLYEKEIEEIECIKISFDKDDIIEIDEEEKEYLAEQYPNYLNVIENEIHAVIEFFIFLPDYVYFKQYCPKCEYYELARAPRNYDF